MAALAFINRKSLSQKIGHLECLWKDHDFFQFLCGCVASLPLTRYSMLYMLPMGVLKFE